MPKMTNEDVAHAVQKTLRHAEMKLGQGGRPIRVLADRLERKEDAALGHEWWIVPVEIGCNRPSMYVYYEVLSMVEQQLEETASLDVLLVPLVPEEKAA